jgi:uncharacterized protein YxjI
MTYIIEQKLAALVNQYRVFSTDQDGNKSQIIAFAQQKRFAFKERIDFYADESKSSVIFSVKAEKVMDIHGKFIVIDEKDKPIGAIRKNFGSSLLRSTWEILNDDSVYITVQERSVFLAVMRRVWGFIPFIGDLPFLFKFHFDFLSGDPPQVVATYNKEALLRDHYRLEVSDARVVEKVGWQTLVAQAVMLDALQGR